MRDSEGMDQGKSVAGLIDCYYTLLRYYWIIVILVIFAAIFATYKISRMPRLYESTATIEIEREKRGTEVGDSRQIELNQLGKINTVSQKLQLLSLFQQVVRMERFQENNRLIPGGKVERVGELTESQKDALAKNLKRSVKVQFRPRTSLIDIRCTRTDPETARDVIAGMLEKYSQLNYTAAAGASQESITYLTQKAQEIETNLRQTENTILLYREALMVKARIRESQEEILEMEKVYLPKWPALQEANQLLGLQMEQYRKEIARILVTSGAEREYWSSQGITEIESADPDSLLKLAEVRSTVLEKNLEGEQELYNSLVSKIKQGDLVTNFETKEFDIVQPPLVSNRPVSPVPSRIYLRYIILGAGAGCIIIIALVFMDQTVRKVTDLEQLSKLPLLSVISEAKELKANREDTTGQVLVMKNQDQSALVESFRTLRTALSLLGPAEERRTFIVTSACPGEGKSSIASNLAVAFARQGEKTLLIDFDLRRPKLHHIFNVVADKKGAVDYITQSLELEEVVVPTGVEDLDILVVGKRIPNPGELLNSKRVGELIRSAADAYDRVIIDTAPVVAVSDTFLIAKHVDSVCLVFKMWDTSRQALFRALKQFEINKIKPVGIVANGMPRKKGFGQQDYYYSYSDSQYYYDEG